ncbi:hypothetical protein D3C73_1212530 [compost metagenome]
MVKKYRHHQGQRFIPGVEMTLHRGNGIAHQSKCHVGIRRTLMFNQRIDVAITLRCLQRPQYIGIAGPQVFLYKTAGFKLQRVQLAKVA